MKRLSVWRKSPLETQLTNTEKNAAEELQKAELANENIRSRFNIVKQGLESELNKTSNSLKDLESRHDALKKSKQHLEE
jgi:hypothetical protein